MITKHLNFQKCYQKIFYIQTNTWEKIFVFLYLVKDIDSDFKKYIFLVDISQTKKIKKI